MWSLSESMSVFASALRWTLHLSKRKCQSRIGMAAGFLLARDLFSSNKADHTSSVLNRHECSAAMCVAKKPVSCTNVDLMYCLAAGFILAKTRGRIARSRKTTLARDANRRVGVPSTCCACHCVRPVVSSECPRNLNVGT